jgi:AcrR family transcriptional regulator
MTASQLMSPTKTLSSPTTPASDSAANSRAIAADDKHARGHSILDAAERLWRAKPNTPINMAEVAQEAGLAKGTVYLYFASKEALLLALHERQIGAYFTAMQVRLGQAQVITADEMIDLVTQHITGHASYMGICSICMGAMETQVSESLMLRHTQLISGYLLTTGHGLEEHHPSLGVGGGVEFLRDCYALILGLWQMLKTSQRSAVLQHTLLPQPEPYPQTCERALRKMWASRITD